MEFKDLYLKRRTCRSYKPIEVEEDKLTYILDAGMHAPVSRGSYKDYLLYSLKGEKFELNESSIYTSLMPSNSNKLNKYLVSKSNEDILDFSVEVLSLNEEATLKIEVKNNEKQSI